MLQAVLLWSLTRVPYPHSHPQRMPATAEDERVLADVLLLVADLVQHMTPAGVRVVLTATSQRYVSLLRTIVDGRGSVLAYLRNEASDSSVDQPSEHVSRDIAEAMRPNEYQDLHVQVFGDNSGAAASSAAKRVTNAPDASSQAALAAAVLHLLHQLVGYGVQQRDAGGVVGAIALSAASLAAPAAAQHTADHAAVSASVGLDLVDSECGVLEVLGSIVSAVASGTNCAACQLLPTTTSSSTYSVTLSCCTDHASRCHALVVLELLVARRCVLAYLCSDGSSQLAKLLPILVFAAGRHRSPDSWQGKAVVRRAGQVSTARLSLVTVSHSPYAHTTTTTTTLHTPCTQCLARLSTVALEAGLSTPWCDQGRSLAWVERLAFDREASVRCSGYLVYAGLLRCVHGPHPYLACHCTKADPRPPSPNSCRWARADLLHRPGRSDLVNNAIRALVAGTECAAVRAACALLVSSYVASSLPSAASDSEENGDGSDVKDSDEQDDDWVQPTPLPTLASATAPPPPPTQQPRTRGAAASTAAGEASERVDTAVLWLEPLRKHNLFTRLPQLLSAAGSSVLLRCLTLMLSHLMRASPGTVGDALLQADAWPALLTLLSPGAVSPSGHLSEAGLAVVAAAPSLLRFAGSWRQETLHAIHGMQASVLALVCQAMAQRPLLRAYFTDSATELAPSVLAVLCGAAGAAGGEPTGKAAVDAPWVDWFVGGGAQCACGERLVRKCMMVLQVLATPRRGARNRSHSHAATRGFAPPRGVSGAPALIEFLRDRHAMDVRVEAARTVTTLVCTAAWRSWILPAHDKPDADALVAALTRAVLALFMDLSDEGTADQGVTNVGIACVKALLESGTCLQLLTAADLPACRSHTLCWLGRCKVSLCGSLQWVWVLAHDPPQAVRLHCSTARRDAGQGEPCRCSASSRCATAAAHA